MQQGSIHSGRSLFQGAIWSVAGQVAPMAVAMVTIPRLLHTMGDERFGLLMLLWLLVGYFSILDLGLGRALILAFSRLHPGAEDRKEISSVYWTGLAILVSLGVLAGAIVDPLAPAICGLVGVTPALMDEASDALRIAGWTMPAILVLHVFLGLPTAFQRQRELNFLRIPAGMFSHLVPFTMVAWTVDLRDLMWANLALRLVLLVPHAMVAYRIQPIDWPPRPSTASAAMLLGTGSWMMVTNIVAPLLTNVDRLLIGHVSGPAALSSYAPAMDLASKAFLLPGVCLSLLFPALGHHIAHAPEKAVAMYSMSLRAMAWWMTPFLVLAVGLSGPAMRLWLGERHGVPAGVFLSVFFVGLLCSLTAQIPFLAIQASGKAWQSSILHAIELPLYIGGLWLAIHHGNLVAVAWIWSLRHLADTTVMHLLARRLGLKAPRESEFLVPLVVGLVVAASLAALSAMHPWSATAGAGVAFGLWLAYAWFSRSGQAAIPGFLRDRFFPSTPAQGGAP